MLVCGPSLMNQQKIANETTSTVAGTLAKQGKLLRKIFWAVLVPLLVTVVAQFILTHITATKHLEYKVTHDKLSDYLPQNLDAVAQISIDKKLYPDLHIYTLEFWNRTSADIGRMRIRVVPDKAEAAVAVHKVLLRTSIYEADWIRWVYPNDLNKWDMIVDFTHVNWEPAANYTIRLFLPDEVKNGFSISTNEPGIRFEPFSIEKEHWWLFGLDSFVSFLTFWCGLGLVVYGMAKLVAYLNKKIVSNYIDIVALTVQKNYPDMSDDIKTKMLLVAAHAYAYSLEFALWRKKCVRALNLPKEESGEKPPDHVV